MTNFVTPRVIVTLEFICPHCSHTKATRGVLCDVSGDVRAMVCAGVIQNHRVINWDYAECPDFWACEKCSHCFAVVPLGDPA